MLLRRHILPAAKRLGILKRIGWHTFRRSAASLLMRLKREDRPKADASCDADITLELYAQAITEDKREAQNALAALIAGQTIPPIQEAE